MSIPNGAIKPLPPSFVCFPAPKLPNIKPIAGVMNIFLSRSIFPLPITVNYKKKDGTRSHQLPDFFDWNKTYFTMTVPFMEGWIVQV
jgi:hypothetical protein